MSDRQRIAAQSGATYSESVVVETSGARWIFVAGQTARERDGEPIPPHLEGQTERCFEQISELLQLCDAGLADIVQLTTYLTDLSEYGAFAAVRGRLLGDEPPASAAVGVASLIGGALVEIAAIAVADRPT